MSWFVALFARVALLIVWLSTSLVNRAFHGGWLWVALACLLDLAANSYPARNAARARRTREGVNR